MVLLFGFISMGTLMFTWSSMQSAAQYEALMVATGQVTSLSNGAITTTNNTATATCSSSLTSTQGEYYACTGLPSWGSYTVTTTENCAVPSVTVNVSVSAGSAAIGDLLNVFTGRTLSAQSVVMKEGKCPS
jgi:Flp pilus assembly protein TadG